MRQSPPTPHSSLLLTFLNGITLNGREDSGVATREGGQSIVICSDKSLE